MMRFRPIRVCEEGRPASDGHHKDDGRCDARADEEAVADGVGYHAVYEIATAAKSTSGGNSEQVTSNDTRSRRYASPGYVRHQGRNAHTHSWRILSVTACDTLCGDSRLMLPRLSHHRTPVCADFAPCPLSLPGK